MHNRFKLLSQPHLLLERGRTTTSLSISGYSSERAMEHRHRIVTNVRRFGASVRNTDFPTSEGSDIRERVLTRLSVLVVGVW